jgi:UDP-3-O-[3-hydroxymyristoyl] glucosamine N-acyltransferase
MAKYPLRRLAELLGCSISGQAERDITGVSTIDRAGPNELTFLSNLKYAPKAKSTKAAAILASEPVPGVTTLVSPNPYFDFSETGNSCNCLYRSKLPCGCESFNRSIRGYRRGLHNR